MFEEEKQPQKDIDLMDFISKSDFSTVGGRAQTETRAPQRQEFDFSNGNPGGVPADDFFKQNNSKPANNPNGNFNDLMDIFSNVPQ